MTDQISPETVRAIDATVMAELTRQQEAGVKFLVGLNVDDLVAAIAATLPAGFAQTPDHQDVRWAVNVLLEKIAEKFEGWETLDLWRSDAAGTVRSFKHDLSDTSTDRASK